MEANAFWIGAFAVLLTNAAFGQSITPDLSPHSTQMIPVDNDVRLEVLDWGGTGRPLVLLAGLGNNAHVFDTFAPKLASKYHIYAITRRGFGASSAPPSGYTADRLGDDVLAVIDFLRLTKPVLVGHSIAGEELSSVGSRHPEKVAGLVYLDAAYGYAFYNSARGDLNVDLVDLQKKLAEMQSVQDTRALIKGLLETTLPGFERDLRNEQRFLGALPPAIFGSAASKSMPMASRAIVAGEQKYTSILAPALAIFALPHDMGAKLNGNATARAAFDAEDESDTGAQARAFAEGVPASRVVRLPYANHYIFRSNEAEVLREINAFVDGLP